MSNIILGRTQFRAGPGGKGVRPGNFQFPSARFIAWGLELSLVSPSPAEPGIALGRCVLDLLGQTSRRKVRLYPSPLGEGGPKGRVRVSAWTDIALSQSTLTRPLRVHPPPRGRGLHIHSLRPSSGDPAIWESRGRSGASNNRLFMSQISCPAAEGNGLVAQAFSLCHHPLL